MLMYNMMKPFLHQATIEKMRIFGSNREEWIAAILEEVDADQVPAFYGGSLTDPDGEPKCLTKVSISLVKEFLKKKN